MADLAKLIRRRGAHNLKFTNFEKYLTDVENSLPNGQTNLAEASIKTLNERQDALRLVLSSEFEQTQSQIEDLEEEDQLDSHFQYRAEVENMFSNICTRVYELNHKSASDKVGANLQQRPSSPAESVQSLATSVVSQNNSRANFLKLPTIPLPKFDGTLLQWLDFRETFQSLIHHSNRLEPVEKFHYLKSSISKTPEEIISGLSLTPDNYTLAWDLICDRFNNDRRLIDAHVEALFNLEPPSRESASLLRKLFDGMNKNIRALKLLGQPTESWDTLIIHLISNKFDSTTARAWEEFKLNRESLTIEQLSKFMQGRCDLLDTLDLKNPKKNIFVNSNSGNKNSKAQHNQFNSKTKSFQITDSKNCIFCSESHAVYNCDSLLKLPIKDRIALVKSKNLCINCLKSGHKTNTCRSSSCKKCGSKHNTLLHINNSPSESHSNTQNNPSTSTSGNFHSSLISGNLSNYILLSTAMVEVTNKDNSIHYCRALLDSGSQSNFITESLCNKLKLPKFEIQHSVTGLNSSITPIRYQTTIQIKARHNNFTTNLSCLVVPTTTDQLPSTPIQTHHLQIPQNILLADPCFSTPGKIDILIGAGNFWNLICIGQISLDNQQPVLQKTLLGWVISGPLSISSMPTPSSQCHFINNNDLQQQITKFWEIESISSNTKHVSKEEAFCENHFTENTNRDSQGRFIVKIPFKENPENLGQSYDMALKRFYNLERKLIKSPELNKAYTEFISEYINLDHMSQAISVKNNSYFLPHHAVHKADSLSTKTCVVFDGSAKTSSGKSLNDIQAVGPVIQQDLFSILLRFRQHNVAITADITKMYRQIIVDKNERHFQSILWRFNPNENIAVYNLNTVTYGTAAASFLAIRALQQTAHENAYHFPNAASTIIEDFYVDDLLTGGQSVNEAKTLINQIIKILDSGCFELRKFVSNNRLALSDIPTDSSLKILEIGAGENSKTLGLWWNPNSDAFQFIIQLHNLNLTPTKRRVLSCISQVFDPLGLLSPVIILFKIFMQQLWQAKVTWDESLPHNLHSQWLKLYDTLNHINKISVPRHVVSFHPKCIELHGFSDASQNAYGGCLYIRSIDNSIPSKRIYCAQEQR